MNDNQLALVVMVFCALMLSVPWPVRVKNRFTDFLDRASVACVLILAYMLYVELA